MQEQFWKKDQGNFFRFALAIVPGVSAAFFRRNGALLTRLARSSNDSLE
jgi:hypothetical protein